MGFVAPTDGEGRRAREAAETAVEAIQRASLDALEQGVALFDFSSGVRLMNQAGTRMLGFNAEELTQRFASGNWETYREDGTVLPLEERPFARSMAGEVVDGMILGWRTKADELLVLRVSTRPITDADGCVTSVVVAFSDVTADLRAEAAAAEAAAALAAAEAELRRSFEQSAMAMVLIDPAGQFTRVNQAFGDLFGARASELVGQTYLGLLHPADREDTLERSRRILEGALDSDVLELRLLRTDGSTLWVRLTVTAVHSPDGSLLHTVAQVEDITAAHLARLALEASEARFAALVERSTDIICLFDAAGTITYASPAGERLLGYAPGSRIGTAFADLVHPDDSPVIVTTFADLVEHPGSVRTAEVRVANHAGQWRHVEVVATNRLHDPAVGGIVANVRDVTERAEAASRLAWQAFHDQLTGLPNRSLLLDRLRQALNRARRSGETTALLFIDLDRFKLVNDTMGHEAGDRLLIEVCARLVQAVRADDTVARFGGDEFVVLAEALSERGEADAMAQRIIEVLARPIQLENGDVSVSGSVGIAFDHDHRPETLLREADTALYRAKERGKNRYEIFDESLRVEAVRRMASEQLLRRALDDGGLQVHYQPIVDLVTGAMVGAEALLRIPGSDGQLQAPGDFITIAEESGLIIPIGAGVLDDACGQLARWRAELGIDAPQRVTVNLASRQLAATGFVDLVRRVLDAHGLAPADLVMELTESTVIEADPATLRSVDGLHELGVALAIDDFGTGYSSLAYLKRFPIDIVKLDRSFVAGLGTDPSDTAIVKAVVSLGRTLGLLVVAEGIETPEQLDALRELGCDCGQGFLLARPAAGDRLLEQRALVAAALAR